MRFPQEVSWPFFEDVHRAFARGFHAWLDAERLTGLESEGGDGDAARAVFRELGREGWLEYSLPWDRGARSGGFDLRTVALMREMLGYRAAFADVAFSEPWLGVMPIALFGSTAIKGELLAGYGRGEVLPAFALSEPDAGSDVASIETRAWPDGSDYVIRGRKTWTSNAGLADVYVVFARTGEGEGPKGLSAFVVDASLPGITLEERISVLSPHAPGTLRFDDVRVPANRLLGNPGGGFQIAMTTLERFRPTVGAAALGLARRAMDLAVARSLERATFGKSICEHQLVQGKLADMAVKIDAAALLVYRASWMHDVARSRIAREAAMAKLYATEAAQEVVDQAQQLFGGSGLVHGADVERLYRHVRAFRILDGTSDIQRLIIARDLVGAFRSEKGSSLPR